MDCDLNYEMGIFDRIFKHHRATAETPESVAGGEHTPNYECTQRLFHAFRDGPEIVSTIEFSAQYFEDVLEAMVGQSPILRQTEIGPILSWVKARVPQMTNVVQLPDAPSRFPYSVMQLLDAGKCEVACKACGVSFNARDISRKTWDERGANPTHITHGASYVCPQNHLVFKAVTSQTI